MVVTQYKNDNVAFHQSLAVSGGLALESDFMAVLNCEKLTDNFAWLKAQKILCDGLSYWMCWWQIFGIS